MLSEPKISYKPFWGICRPLNSWRANSPNPIQIYCAKLKELDFSSCEIENIAVSSDKLTGVVVNSSQALEFVRLLGIVVKD